MSIEHQPEKASQLNNLVVVVDSLNVPKSWLAPFVERIFKATERAGCADPKVLIAMHKGLDPENTARIQETVKKDFPRGTSTVVVARNTFAYAYLKGLQAAMDLGDYVVELDSGGGHKPEEITRFVDGFSDSDVVWSSRFIKGGKNTYPFQRRLVSKAVTYLSNGLLGTRLSDASSGFQGFKSDVLKNLFAAIPPEQWLSAIDGPFHMYQTEMRAYVTWAGATSLEVPISYGAEKKGKSLPIPYLMDSLLCFIKIWKNMPEKTRLLQRDGAK